MEDGASRGRRRTVKLDQPVDLKHEGKKIGRLLGIVLELDEQLTPAEQQQLAIERGGSGFDPVAEVWRHYVAVMKPRNAGLSEETRRLIRDALKVGTIQEWKSAIDGCAASDFHMGKNDRRKKYNRPSHIFKGKRGTRTTREQLDLFLDILERSGQSRVTSVDGAKVQRAKRDVLDGQEFPGDQRIADKAKAAKALLEEQGWTVTISEGRVEFTPPPEPS